MDSLSPQIAADDGPGSDGREEKFHRMRLAMVSAASGAVVSLAAVALFLWYVARSGDADLPVLGPAPHYQLINQNNRKVSSQNFVGKVQIVTAVFPYCRELCPLVAANLAEFRDNVVKQSDLEGRVVFVFFNVAPTDAGPPEMREFLQQYGWNPKDPSVQFLTGTPGEIESVVKRGFHIAYYRTKGDDDDGSTIEIANPLADRMKPDFDIKHTDIIEVVDGDGRIRKIFDDGTRVSDTSLQNAVAPLLR